MAKEPGKTSVNAEEVKKGPAITPGENGEQPVKLLDSITYTDEFQYEEWLKNMDLNQSVFVLVAAAQYSQKAGILSIAESELIAGALRTIKKNSKQVPPSEVSSVVPPVVEPEPEAVEK